MKARRALTVALAGLLLAGVAGAAFWRFGRPLPVPVVTAADGAVALRIVGPATLQARVAVTASARLTATVAQVLADVGDPVARGQLLVLLDDREQSARRAAIVGQQEALARNTEAARAALAKAQADLDLARVKQRRDADLLRQGFVSQAVLDGSDAALQAAEAGVAGARATLAAREADARSLAQEARASEAVLSYARVVATVDGVVVQRLVEPGSTVVAGAPMLKLVDPKTLWAATRVDESMVGRIQLGQAASVRMRTGELRAGKVARIARQSDAATREMEIDVAFEAPPERFAIDQEAEVTIDAGLDRGVVVPLAALARDASGRQGVFVVAAQRARFQPVETGSADAERAIVRKGLTLGEAIVASAQGVKDGQRVRADPLSRP